MSKQDAESEFLSFPLNNFQSLPSRKRSLESLAPSADHVMYKTPDTKSLIITFNLNFSALSGVWLICLSRWTFVLMHRGKQTN